MQRGCFLWEGLQVSFLFLPAFQFFVHKLQMCFIEIAGGTEVLA